MQPYAPPRDPVERPASLPPQIDGELPLAVVESLHQCRRWLRLCGVFSNTAGAVFVLVALVSLVSRGMRVDTLVAIVLAVFMILLGVQMHRMIARIKIVRLFPTSDELAMAMHAHNGIWFYMAALFGCSALTNTVEFALTLSNIVGWRMGR
jgi:predicted membrane-bound mannosyltransferase